jgi:hypothetical protein
MVQLNPGFLFASQVRNSRGAPLTSFAATAQTNLCKSAIALWRSVLYLRLANFVP